MAKIRTAQLVFQPPSAQEVMERLKKWIVAHRPRTRLELIAAELGLPHKRLARALRGKDNLAGFKWDILEKLNPDPPQPKDILTAGQPAWKGGTGTVLTLVARRNRTTPPSPAEIKRAQKNLISQVRQENVFCQIVGQDISTNQCLNLQGKPECFGCAAPSRLCQHCHVNFLAFAEIDLCEDCLEKELASAARQEIPNFPSDTQVSCPLVKRAIGVVTCRSMQGPACGNCDAPSRICSDCCAKPVRYPEYGLCLSCTFKTYAPETLSTNDQAIDQSINQEQEETSPAGGENMGTTITVPRPDKIAAGTEKIGDDLCIECHKRPVFVKSRKLCSTCSSDFYQKRREASGSTGPSHRGRQTRPLAELLPQARELILANGFASGNLLESGLKIGGKTAQGLLMLLEKEGVVGPAPNMYQRRPVLATASAASDNGRTVTPEVAAAEEPPAEPRELPPPAPPAPAVPVESTKGRPFDYKISTLEQLVCLFGEESRLSPTLRAIINDLQRLAPLEARLLADQAQLEQAKTLLRQGLEQLEQLEKI